MLRSLIQPESLLIKLCQSREWGKVKTLLINSPNEAKPTSSAFRGISSTALVFAILNSAPLEVVKILVNANPDQLMKVRHHRHGNALHESIKHKSSIEIIIFLINTIIKIENESKWLYRGELKPVKIEIGTFPLSKKYKVVAPISQVVDNSNTPASFYRYHTHCTLFNQTDHFGRTPLHYLVERFTKESGESRMLVHAIQLLVQSFPPAVGKRDTDSMTPLDICLISPKVTNSLREMEVEMKVFGLAKMMVKAYPSVAFPALNSAQASILRVNNSFCIHEGGVQNSGSAFVTNSRRIVKNSIDGNIAHNTLSHALMHGRHYSTIELLIGASKTSNPSWHTGHLYDWDEYEMEPLNEENESCMTIVSTDLEVPLHIAVTMRASPEVVAHVVRSGPDASFIPDRCGLTPICWTWMRFVIDEISKAQRGANESSWTQLIVKQSKRRFVPGIYLEVHEKLTNDLATAAFEFVGATDITFLRHIHQNNIERRNLWTKLSCLLPHAAKAHSQSLATNKRILSNLDKVTHWGPVHAAGLISCPRAVLLTAIMNFPKCIKQNDEIGNLPIHYAAANQVTYSKTLPIGVTFSPQTVDERSNVFDLLPLYPESTKVMNLSKQIPLHIAINADKEARKAMNGSQNSRNNWINKRQKTYETNESIEGSVWMYLVKNDIESLEQRDGLTNLYPFMQAAGKKFKFDLFLSLA